MTSKVKNKEKKMSPKSEPLVFPQNLLTPIGHFLSAQLHKLEGNKKKLEQGDPFSNESRTNDNAAPDTEAEEQFGHAKTSALKEQVDRKIVQTRKALSRIKIGKYGICENCGQMIDTDRLVIYPEATLCVKCESKKEK